MDKNTSNVLVAFATVIIVALLVGGYALFRTPTVEFPSTPILEDTVEVMEDEETEEIMEEAVADEGTDSTLLESLLEQETPSVLSTVVWQTQELDELSITIKSPIAFEWEQSPIHRAVLDGQPIGDHGFASIRHGEENVDTALIVAAAPLYGPSGRGGYWGDIIGDVNLEGEVTCDVLSSHRLFVGRVEFCEVFTNVNGHSVWHVQNIFNGFYPDPVLINIYVLEHPDPEIRAVMISDERLLPRDEYRADVISYLSDLGFDTTQSARDLVRTIADTVDFIE